LLVLIGGRKTGPPAATVTNNNLPRQLTSFVGRDQEIAAIERLLARTRLLTLTGSGGCGKTRLALEVGARVVEQFSDGVWWVELAPLSDPTLVPQAVATALEIPEQPRQPLIETLGQHLRSASLLLLLDNCEHLLSGCAGLAETLLHACPGLRILATSREALGIMGETSWRVPSLSFPALHEAPTAGHLTQYEAARLFCERAMATAPAFAVTEANAPVIAQICRRLDGIPLAIELAAVRVKVLTVEQIADRLHDRFRLLIGGSRTALPRHQTLRATMDWSYGLLSDDERAVLRRFSVFAGGCTLAAAETVCAGSGLDAADILDLLTRLVDKSLVVVDTQGGEARYWLLETVRQHSRGKLQEAGETDDAQRRHLNWFLELAERADAKLRGPEQEPWLERLAAEHDNLRAALEGSGGGAGGAGARLRLAGALQWFWFMHGHWNEGRARLEGMLARGAEAPPAALAWALQGAAYLAWRQGDIQRATALSEKGLALARELGDKERISWMLFYLGIATLLKANYEQATLLFQDLLVLSRERQDTWLVSMGLSHLGRVEWHQGNYTKAAALFEEGLTLARIAGDKWLIAYALRNLGHVALKLDDPQHATKCYTEGLALCRSVGDRWVTEECLEGLAGAACAQAYHEEAARLFGAAEALHEILHSHHAAPYQADIDRRIASTRARLGDAGFAAALAEGRAMTLALAIEYALGLNFTEVVPAGSAPAGKPVSKRSALLTAREREVAALIARGLSNRHIASHLKITERTAQTHVQNILNKLGVNSRTQVAVWAVENGLLSSSRD